MPAALAARLTRREALCAGSTLCLAAALPAQSDPPGAAVARLLAEATAKPRAMRDGSPPFSDPDGQKGHLPDNSHDFATATAVRSKALANRAKHLRGRHLSQQDRETLEALIWDLERDAGLAPFYFHEFPLGYSGSQLASLNLHFITTPADPDPAEYLARVRQVPAYVDNIRFRLLGQVERGLTVPRAEAVRALDQLRIETKELAATLRAATDKGASPAFQRDVQQFVEGPLAKAFAALEETLRQRYIPRLTERSRMALAEDAPAYYRQLSQARVSDDLDLASTHETAKDALARIDAELARLRKALGGPADAAAFHRSMAGDPRWFVRDAEDLKSRLEAAIAQVTPLVPQYFTKLPTTPFRVAPLPDFLSGRLLNGYFSPPTKADPRGTYFYNTSHLDVANWSWTKPLVSHELMPGHHLAAALLLETKGLPDYRRNLFVPAYAEGWGEYARQLMEEAGLYKDDSWGLYASRLLERRFTLRTMVETGIHHPSWTWQQAAQDLATDPLTRPETIQQLALSAATFRSTGVLYWWGLRRFVELRARAKRRAGAAFDIRRFHSQVMRGDNLPFPLIERRVLG